VLAAAERVAAVAERQPVLTRVIDHGRTEQGVFLVLEEPDGLPLCEWLRRENGVEPLRALRLTIAVGEALEALHHAALDHGALSADVVFVSEGDVLKVAGLDVTILAGAASPPESEERRDVEGLAGVLVQLLGGMRAGVNFSGTRGLRGVRRPVARMILAALSDSPAARPDLAGLLNELWSERARLDRRGAERRWRVAPQAPAGIVWQVGGAGAAAAVLLGLALGLSSMRVRNTVESDAAPLPGQPTEARTPRPTAPPGPLAPSPELVAPISRPHSLDTRSSAPDTPSIPRAETASPGPMPKRSDDLRELPRQPAPVPTSPSPTRPRAPVTSAPGPNADGRVDDEDPGGIIDWLLRERVVSRE
jgi:hypothetical protein